MDEKRGDMRYKEGGSWFKVSPRSPLKSPPRTLLIGEIEQLRKTSRSNLATSNDMFQKELYINKKLTKFTDMIVQQRISNEDLKKTLSKIK